MQKLREGVDNILFFLLFGLFVLLWLWWEKNSITHADGKNPV